MSWVKETRNIFPAARIFHKNAAYFFMYDLMSCWEFYRKKNNARV
jgi:hypothetical protein